MDLDWFDSYNPSYFIDQPFICPICAERFQYKTNLDEHKNRCLTHESSTVSATDYAEETKHDPNAPMGKFRKREVTDYKKFFVCDPDTTKRLAPIVMPLPKPKTEALLEFSHRHYFYKFIDEPYICLECGSRFATPNAAQIHTQMCMNVNAQLIKSNSSSRLKRPVKYPCPACSVSFREHKTLIEHLNYAHQSTNRYKCQVCFMTQYKSRRKLTVHVRKDHPDVKLLMCPGAKCKLGFFTAHDLDKHCSKQHSVLRNEAKGVPNTEFGVMLEPTPDRMSICEICGKCVRHLSLHLETHNEKRTFKCTLCAKMYKTSMLLRAHMHTHEKKERKRHCAECDKYFSYDSAYYIHRKYYHKEGEFKYKCKECGKKFFFNFEYKLHMNMHFGIKRFPCTFCAKAYTYPSSLRGHLKTAHADKPRQPINFKISNLQDGEM